MLKQRNINRRGYTFTLRDVRTTSDYNGRCDENPYRVIVWTDSGLNEWADFRSVHDAIIYILSFDDFAWF